MKIFIDSATVSEIKKADSYGILDGVTTNPSLIKRAVDSLKKAGKNIDMQRYIEDILKTAKGTPVSLEVIGADADTIIAEGKALFRRFNSIANNVVIKVPVNPAFKADDTTHFDGIKAIKALSAQGIPINCTLIFTPEQAILAAKAGAMYVSPFAGRVDDDLRKISGIEFDKADYYPSEGMVRGESIISDNGVVSGIDLVSQIAHIFAAYDIKTEILAASLRNPRQV